MLRFFGTPADRIFAVQHTAPLSLETLDRLSWLFGDQPPLDADRIDGSFVGPRAAMVTPWSTNAVEITQNMGIDGIERIEQFRPATDDFDPMLAQCYPALDAAVFTVDRQPEPIQHITDIAAYNEAEGLALNAEEVQYLNDLAVRLDRPLTDSEVFGFSQVNSEHCRHKIFNGIFVIDGEEKQDSLFRLIKATSKAQPAGIVSAYKDNVAFLAGPRVSQFAPARPEVPSNYVEKPFDSILSLKAETHNFPTTVEPFNGAATGSGGEIRDRMAGGTGSIPLAGTAVYMTAYPELGRERAYGMTPRKWLYQSPLDILIKASNGASDFGNKFGQPLIAGSVLTFEHAEHGRRLGYDKVIMQAGGIGYGKAEMAQKQTPQTGDRIVLLGGDNYRIGMGGAAVSSADTGEFSSGIELNAVQRSNPEMQKRVSNAVRALVESDHNPIVSIHDHGAGGHLNCLSELVEDTGGKIDLAALPVGDPTLSAKEIIGNESQERMGLVIAPDKLDTLRAVAARERAPLYEVGIVTGDERFSFVGENGEAPMDLALADMFGSSPKTILRDETVDRRYAPVDTVLTEATLTEALHRVLTLEAVACKDWLTNKVDRCVGGRVAKQQCAGPLQLPLNNCGVMALDFTSGQGIATSIGHAPIGGLIDARAGAINSIAEALTNIVWAPLEKGLKSVSLSANWMWPCRNPGEDARLYAAVEAVSQFCIALGINVPTGKDSLSMRQKYPDGEVLSPGTVVISAAGHCDAIDRVVEPVLQRGAGAVYYVDLNGDDWHLGGSSYAQTQGRVGETVPTVRDAAAFATAFGQIQQLIRDGHVAAGHDVSAGGLLTALLEMCFAEVELGMLVSLSIFDQHELANLLFSERTAVVLQATDQAAEAAIEASGLAAYRIGEAAEGPSLSLLHRNQAYQFDLPSARRAWFSTSYLLDQHQTANDLATERFRNFDRQALTYQFPKAFTGKLPNYTGSRPQAAIIREKGSNSERELAHALHLAGFDVRDVHMTDLISGRETLEDVRFLGAVGGFSNSDVLGSAKGWAGAFKYNPRAKAALDGFFAREDVLSVGICNGCQLFVELNLINPEHAQPSAMHHNDSGKHESIFTSVEIPENNAVMLRHLAGTRLGVWVSHGEGKFHLPEAPDQYNIVGTYGFDKYPANPNNSDYNTAMLASADGRHLVMMPHIERSIFPWNWAYYDNGRTDDVGPWLQAFVSAREWLTEKR